MKGKSYRYIIVVLIALNLVSIFFLLKPHGPHHHPPMLTDVIKMKDPNKSIVNELEKKHFDTIEIYAIQLRSHRRLLYTLYEKNASTTKKDSVIQLIGLSQQKIDRSRFEFFTKIKKYCTEEQKSKLNEFIYRMIENESMRRPKRK